MNVKDRASGNEQDVMGAVPMADLMSYADGELDPGREAEVEAQLRQDPHASAVVATVFEMGELVREVAEARARDAGADDIASWVMARIEQEKAGNVVVLRPASSGEPAPTRVVSIWPMAVGGLAAAAAVALLVWRFAGVDLVQPAPGQAVAPSTNPELVVASAPLPAVDYDPEPGVSVDVVDFGARTGTIFYVPSDTGTTTVVWLTDDEAGGN